ncbi:carbonic anhydrase [Nocardia shimofusensis]|uniref:carbonic anhydrase n=1 Tax=Nocardia shimofusensis TaxID=228596 RepID=UPI000832BD5A|nr:carbonic anhydrase family protein [Nocardia shimofusensis]
MPTPPSSRAVIGRRGLLTAAALLALSGCGSSDNRSDAANPPHWDYDAEGPDHWAEIDGRYAVCGRGTEQSPIDLADHTPVDTTEHVDITYGPVPALELVNTGHTVQANLPAGSGHRIAIGGREFALSQFHFHAPSEHTVDGVGADMELHMVHGDATGGLAVLAVLLVVGQRSPFTSVLADLPLTGDKRTLDTVDLRTFLPGDLTQFRYTGSLTTPPCTEGVAWTVLRDPVTVGADEVDRFRALFPHNNRPAQPRNGRPVALAGG